MLRRDHGTHHMPLSMASPPLLHCNTASPGLFSHTSFQARTAVLPSRIMHNGIGADDPYESSAPIPLSGVCRSGSFVNHHLVWLYG